MGTTDTAVPTRVALAYGTGQLGAQIFRDTPAVLLPLFMTTMLGVAPWIAGLVVLVPKLWLIACDPLMGAWSDRVKPSRGRTPFLLAGAILTSLTFVALFWHTGYSSAAMAAVVTCALFFVGSTAFSMFSVPYLAIGSELSPDPHQRTRVMMYRLNFMTIGVVVGVGAAQPLMAAFGGGAAGWRAMGLVFGLLCIGTMMVTAIGLKGVKLIEGAAAPGNFLSQLKQLGQNTPFRVLLTAHFIQSVGQASSYTVIAFIYLYAVKAIWIILPFVLVMSVVAIASQPVWVAMSRRFGKERCYVAAMLGWTLVTASWFFVKPADDVIFAGLGTQHILVLVRAVVIGVFNASFIMLALSMLTDTIAYERDRTGSANEGVFSGIFSAAEKLAFALGPVIAGVVMSVYGFRESTGGMVEQTPEAITGIVLLYSLFPVATQLVALAVFSRYRLPKSA
ncbi:MFS transporter [Novosphingobium sp.]|uniref:MFS transporter n=1 Tax=Novosphingobium sp. TaxID=1874826 RepID=UPI00286E9C1E|nr:MFS transporter [Novosphingobium sp.]